MADAKMKTMLGRALRGAAYGLAATTAAVVLSVAPAYAEENGDVEIQADTCSGGRFCMWEDSSYSGSRYANWAPTGTNQKYQLDGWDGDNEITSFINNTRYKIRVYDNDDYSGESRCIDPGQRVSNLSGSWDFNDRIESAKTVAAC
ncbi:peptidase inhibitor family I36 protein [Glycomyces luteolus]|uniref:Peptidase inhibitor family I36 protein n=1 Tax=Glycomyces luteolus TaxID=2670330 RepID=A0A9X3T6C3_9ACTN|nr:peptidase inhibitor family I36 protein [Glycomyces luteolus]MDA1362740.1 peptidase inhibitor family I36 protein [Glycomyces luteolus]